MVHVLIGYIHSQRIIDQATEGLFTAPLGIPAQLFGMGYPKFAGRAALSALLFQGVMVQLTISLPGSFSQPCGGGGAAASSWGGYRFFRSMRSWSRLVWRPCALAFRVGGHSGRDSLHWGMRESAACGLPAGSCGARGARFRPGACMAPSGSWARICIGCWGT